MANQTAATPPVADLTPLPRRQVALTMAGVMLALFLASLDQTIVGTAMPRVIAELGGFSHYTWVTTAYLMSSTAVVPIVGRLGDMYGRKMFYIVGLAVFLAGSALSGLSASMGQLIAFRALQGLGGGIMLSNAFVSVGDLYPPHERAKRQGMLGAVFGLSSVIGPTLGGYITDALSWRWIFYINLPLGLALLPLFMAFFPKGNVERRRHTLDYAGAFTLIAAVVSVLVALSWAGVEHPWGSPQVLGLLALGVAMTGAFLWIETRAPEPLLPLSLFGIPEIRVSLMVVFLIGFAMFGAIIFVPLFFQGVMGASATRSGNFLTPMMLGMVFGGMISGQLLSRWGHHYRLQGLFGIALLAAGLFLLSTMTPGTSQALAVVYIIAAGFGVGITFPVYNIAVQNVAPRPLMGVATSSLMFFRTIGGSLGLAMLGAIVTRSFGDGLAAAVPPAVQAALPPGYLGELAHNPQALLSPEAMAQLQAALGPAAALLPQLLAGLRLALAGAMSHVFLAATLVALAAGAAAAFLKDSNLRRVSAAPTEAATPSAVAH